MTPTLKYGSCSPQIRLLGVSFLLISLAYGQLSTDVEVMRERLITSLLVAPVDAQQVEQVMNSMTEDGTWPFINYRDTSRTGFQHSVHLGNLLTMAKAYQQTGGTYHHDTQLLSAFKKALAHWLKEDYRCENWWWNEI